MPQLFHLSERFAPFVDQEIHKEEFEGYQLMEDTDNDIEEGGVIPDFYLGTNVCKWTYGNVRT
jgi:hypothetical protein